MKKLREMPWKRTEKESLENARGQMQNTDSRLLLIYSNFSIKAPVSSANKVKKEAK